MLKRRSTSDSKIERQIIIAMIVSDQFLQQINPIYRKNSLAIPYARTVAEWCQEYHSQYQEAPGKHIKDLFHTYSKNGTDPDQTELIENFLTELSEDYERAEIFNVPYLLDQTEKYFRKRALEETNTELSACLTGNRIDDAEAAISGFNRIVRPESQGVNLVTDREVIERAFDKDSGEVMFSLPGDVGKMLGPMIRGSLVAVVGEQKAGKTWWLQEFLFAALFARFNTLKISFENTVEQMTRRNHQKLSGLPLEAGNILIPVFDCMHNQDDSCSKSFRTCETALLNVDGNKPKFEDVDSDYQPCTVCRGRREFSLGNWFVKERKKALDAEQAIRKGEAIARSRFRGARYKFLYFPSDTLKVSDLKSQILNLEYYEDFVPDVIITDYADKMLPEDNRDEKRHKISQIWRGHKAIALERHCLVITASQSNTARTGKNIGKGSWAEDISKLGEVDKAIAINQTDSEKLEGIRRVSVIAERHEEFNVKNEVTVLECLKIGRPIVDSYFNFRRKR